MNIKIILFLHQLITIHGFSYSIPSPSRKPCDTCKVYRRKRGNSSSSLPFIPSTQLTFSKLNDESNYADMRTRTTSNKQRELEQLKYPVVQEDDEYDEYIYEDYYDDNDDDDNDDDDEYNDNDQEEDQYDTQEYYEDDDEYTERNRDMKSNTNSARGNFWSNPQRTLDSYTPSSNKQRPSKRTSQRQREILASPTRRGRESSKKKMRKTFRSGNPPPPNIIKEFYDKLFWYGFDADETTSAADRTMFGGTKGKFNGLNLLEDINSGSDSMGRKPFRSRRRKSFELSNEYDDDDYDDEYDDEYDAYDEYDDEYDDDYPEERMRDAPRSNAYRRKNSTRSSLMLPSSRSDKETIQRRRQSTIRTKSSRKKRFNIDDWFDEEEEDEPTRDESESSPLINILDKVFQIDPNEVKYRADDYNRRLGLNKKKSEVRSRMGSTSTTEKKKRKGYAYPYVQNDNIDDDENIDDLYEIIELDISEEDINDKQDAVEPILSKDDNVIDVEAAVTTSVPTVEKKEETRNNSNRSTKKQTWEDRAAANERIPPKGVIAWGPDGEMDMDARTYAAKSAMEEIENAKILFSKKEEAVNVAEQNLIELKR